MGRKEKIQILLEQGCASEIKFRLAKVPKTPNGSTDNVKDPKEKRVMLISGTINCNLYFI